MIPQETDAEILEKIQDDAGALWLYQLTKVKSSDMNFSMSTDFLLYRILHMAFEAETESDFQNSLQYFRPQAMIYFKSYVSTIFQKVHAHPEWFE